MGGLLTTLPTCPLADVWATIRFIVEFAINVIGWIGAGGVLAAYALVSTGRIAAASYTYQALNLVGAVGLAINTFYYMSYPSTALNVTWALIAVYAIAKLVSARREPPP
jgi:hypothetical protein